MVGLKERGGPLATTIVETVSGPRLLPEIQRRVRKGSLVITDEHPAYRKLPSHGYDHASVNHGLEEYVRGPIHTNSIESVWAIFKRSLQGVHHAVSPKHLPRYLAEAAFRLHDGKVSHHVLDRMTALCQRCVNVHLPYAKLTGKPTDRRRT